MNNDMLDKALRRIGNPSLKDLEAARKRVSERLKERTPEQLSTETLLDAQPANVWPLRRPLLIGAAAAVIAVAVVSSVALRKTVPAVVAPTTEAARTDEEPKSTPEPQPSVERPRALPKPKPVQPPSFEFASLRRDTRGGRTMLKCQGSDMTWTFDVENVPVPKGQCIGTNVTLMTLIAGAYRLPPEGVAGGPDWIDAGDVSFQLQAKAEDTENTTTDELRQMLQALLAQRFQLQFHRERREVLGYALVSGGALRFAPSSSEESSLAVREEQPGRTIYELKAQSIATLADLLSSIMRISVLDRTGLNGKYDLTLSLTNAGGRRPKKDPGPLPKVVEDQLGLRLQLQQVQVEILVVDHAAIPVPKK